SAISNGKITTATFGVSVRKRTAARAKEYKLTLNPQCLVDPEPAVLYDKKKPPRGEPDLQPWPPAGTASVMGTAIMVGVDGGVANRTLDLVRTDKQFRRSMLGPGFGLDLHELAVPPDELKIPRKSKYLLQDLVTLRGSPAAKAPRGRRKAEAMVR